MSAMLGAVRMFLEMIWGSSQEMFVGLYPFLKVLVKVNEAAVDLACTGVQVVDFLACIEEAE